jgi:hypothetical protein
MEFFVCLFVCLGECYQFSVYVVEGLIQHVSFSQTPNTPNAVTRDDLAAALLQCLIASPAFAEFCIPLLLEKLDSQLRIAKLDSLRLLVSSST